MWKWTNRSPRTIKATTHLWNNYRSCCPRSPPHKPPTLLAPFPRKRQLQRFSWKQLSSHHPSERTCRRDHTRPEAERVRISDWRKRVQRLLQHRLQLNRGSKLSVPELKLRWVPHKSDMGWKGCFVIQLTLGLIREESRHFGVWDEVRQWQKKCCVRCPLSFREM